MKSWKWLKIVHPKENGIQEKWDGRNQLGPSCLPDSKHKGNSKRWQIKNWWLLIFSQLLKCNRKSLKPTALQDSTIQRSSSSLNSHLVNTSRFYLFLDFDMADHCGNQKACISLLLGFTLRMLDFSEFWGLWTTINPTMFLLSPTLTMKNW